MPEVGVRLQDFECWSFRQLDSSANIWYCDEKATILNNSHHMKKIAVQYNYHYFLLILLLLVIVQKQEWLGEDKNYANDSDLTR